MIADKQKPEEEPIEFVSHYIIVNQTGYPLDIYDSGLILKHRIENHSQINYNVQLEDADTGSECYYNSEDPPSKTKHPTTRKAQFKLQQASKGIPCMLDNI